MNYHQLPSSISKRTKIWPPGKPPLRRLINQVICRLPLFVLWTLVVIFLLYKLTNSDKIDEKTILNPVSFTSKEIKNKVKTEPLVDHHQSKTLTNLSKSFDKSLLSDNIILDKRISNSKPSVITAHSLFSSISTTKKSSILEYARQSKVFILIIQNENDYVYHLPIKRFSQITSSTADKSNLNSKIVIPPHIKMLINILESHRIEYNIDSTRTGLPTSLLIDQHNPIKKYSVIVIDDFLKYTKLNRWIRDQLDRHCRLNQIGVITYFTADEIELTRSSLIADRWKRSSRSIKDILLNQKNLTSTSYDTSKFAEETLTNEFPISFKPVENKLSVCHKNLTNCLVDYQVNDHSPILRILKRKPDFIIEGPLFNNNLPNEVALVSMFSNHISYEPLTWARIKSNTSISYGKRSVSQDSSFPDKSTSEIVNDNYFADNNIERRILSMFDHGLFDGVKRVIFGGGNYHWVDRILLLDSIEHLSNGKIFTPLERFVQIDIDDIFVGEKGIRMKQDDVRVLIETQRNFCNMIDGGFKFNLGFSGKYFKHGYPEENLGDEELIAKSNEFTWFCHSWGHTKAHLFNDSKSIANELRKNLNFAQDYNIPIIGYGGTDLIKSIGENMDHKPPTYAVAPHHSGVYPIHEHLYEAWHNVLNVQVTSTEEYPGLKPAHRRRAFVYKTIKVLPRQTCGLYTHTIYRNKYPGGIEKLESSIRGGDLFETILHNPVNIYMTHMSNYANDRLAPYTFNALFEFILNNTNLVLKYAPTTDSKSSNGEPNLGPAKLAEHYFKLYPNEIKPLWNNPCYDKRHLAIWAADKHKYCSVLPQVLIVGPQKTGTTALYTFLKMNPIFKSSQLSASDFEEIQFFNDKHYYKTVDWYFDRFVQTNDSDTTNKIDSTINKRDNDLDDNGNYSIYFDKSATYFDDPKVPERAYNLLPEARIIILLINPVDRAYSWYQHVKAHGDPIANSMSFEQIITFNDDYLPEMNSTQLAIKSLRNRCLHPGYYANHLLKWLDYYPSRRVIIIDGQWFKENPASTLERLQKILRLKDSEILDYNKLLVYNKDKGFYCQKLFSKENDHAEVKCLGKGKGRDYPKMSREARSYLDIHYWSHNKQLARILSDIGQPLPTWLDQITNNLHKNSFQR